MDFAEFTVIGVEVSFYKIYISIINSNGDFLEASEFASPRPLIPGALTIELCEFIKTIDKRIKSKFVGVSFPGSINDEKRIIQECKAFPGWSNVPIAYWLKAILQKEIILGNTKECEQFVDLRHGKKITQEHVSYAAIGVGRLAIQKFANKMDTF